MEVQHLLDVNLGLAYLGHDGSLTVSRRFWIIARFSSVISLAYAGVHVRAESFEIMARLRYREYRDWSYPPHRPPWFQG
jgi:hypothetical protein